MAATYYRPRAFVSLSVPLLGTREERTQQDKSSKSIQLRVRPKKVRIESNDHNEADRCSITTDWTQAGVDPRMLDDGIATVYIADADEEGYWQPGTENCRFIGVVKEVEAEREIDKAAEVTLECLDFTDFFLRANPFSSKGVPAFSQTLEDAWRTIVSQTQGAASFANALRFEGDAHGGMKLGDAVAERFAKLGKMPTKPETDAWAVWSQCVGMLGLITFIRLDECIVTTATDYYTAEDSPAFVWGQNLETWSESRVSEVSRTGVGVTSFDVLTRRTIEGVYPPFGDPLLQRKRSKAQKIGSSDNFESREKREYFAIPGIANVARATTIAQRIYEERSRQELAGRVRTRHMAIPRARSGASFDLLSLHAGDSIEVGIDREHRELLASLPSESAQVSYLESQGYTPEVAALMVANMAEFNTLRAKFHVKSVTTELEYTAEGGTFTLDVSYINKLIVSGDTD